MQRSRAVGFTLARESLKRAMRMRPTKSRSASKTEHAWRSHAICWKASPLRLPISCEQSLSPVRERACIGRNSTPATTFAVSWMAFSVRDSGCKNSGGGVGRQRRRQRAPLRERTARKAVDRGVRSRPHNQSQRHDAAASDGAGRHRRARCTRPRMRALRRSSRAYPRFVLSRME